MNVDMQKNLDYYKSESSIVCDCNSCKNFCMQIKEKQPQIYKYLDELNVDILKPFELGWI